MLSLIAINPIVIVAGVIGVIVLILLIAVCAIFTSRRHAKKMVNDVSKRYRRYHDLLVNEISEELKRIYSIAQLNSDYQEVYTKNDEIYQNVLKNEDYKVSQDIDSLKLLLQQKKYKLIKEEVENARKSLSTLEERYTNLEKSLSKILSLDDENRQTLLTYQKKFRDIRDLAESKKFELKYIEPSLSSLFEKLEESFIEINNLFSCAHYQEAQEKFPELKRVIDALEKSLNVLPRLTTLAFVVIPNNLTELKNRYDELIGQGYPLHHLLFQSSVETFEKNLKHIQNRLTSFQTKNAEYELNQIKDSIFKLNEDFDLEVKAKEDFTSSFEELYNGSYQLENRFIKLRRVVPEYKSTYLLKDECLSSLEGIQREINELDTIKRNLDTYVHASSKQPYSLLNAKLLDLKECTEKIKEHIASVQSYLNSLKDDSENAYNYISKAYLELKDYESLLRKVNVKSLINAYKSNFARCYELIDNIGNVIKVTPIDVSAINEYVELLKQEEESLIAHLANIEKQVNQAEEAIVYANQFRLKFYDVRTALMTAEKAFFEGDFARTADETVSILKKIRPEANK